LLHGAQGPQPGKGRRRRFLRDFFIHQPFQIEFGLIRNPHQIFNDF
jgi:hypothetical protein